MPRINIGVELDSMKNQFEDLVGPRSEDREEKILDEVAADGQPLWMAFLADPEALSISKEEVEDAKNALIEAQGDNAIVVALCKNKTIPECKTMLQSSENSSLAA